jgi:hypothetical protein
MNKFLASLSLLLNVTMPFLIFRTDLFLLLLPFFNMVGKWYVFIYLFEKQSYIYDFFEVFTVIAILVTTKYRDRIFWFLLIFPQAALLSLLNTSDANHLAISMYYLILLTCGAGIYSLYRTTMVKINGSETLNHVVLVWTVLGLVYKVLSASFADQSFLVSRTGGLWASNHQASIVLIFLPFVTKGWIALTSIVLLLMHLSRGVYAALALMGMLYYFLVRKKRFLRNVILSALVSVVMVAAGMQLFPSTVDILRNYIVVRLLFGGAGGSSVELADNAYTSGVTGGGVVNALLKDDRFVLAGKALEITKRTNYLGIGLGGFSQGLAMVNFPPDYSNAHNMYLTLLAEGGALFLCLFIGLVLWMLLNAYMLDKRVFISVAVFAFYGLFSGQLYEAGFEKSAMDYYYFLFLLAYIGHLKDHKRVLSTADCSTEMTVTPV